MHFFTRRETSDRTKSMRWGACLRGPLCDRAVQSSYPAKLINIRVTQVSNPIHHRWEAAFRRTSLTSRLLLFQSSSCSPLGANTRTVSKKQKHRQTAVPSSHYTDPLSLSFLNTSVNEHKPWCGVTKIIRYSASNAQLKNDQNLFSGGVMLAKNGSSSFSDWVERQNPAHSSFSNPQKKGFQKFK